MFRLAPLNLETAGEVAGRALGFLASEPDRFARFLALSGLDPSTIRSAAADPGFLPAVLDHVLSDEALVIAFACSEALPPEQVVEARMVLGGAPPEGAP